MIDWRKAQANLGVKIDGDFGPLSYAALLSRVAGRRIGTDISTPFAVHLGGYGVDADINRLAGFLGQTAHESGGYRYTREIWGPTDAQKRYDARTDLGNSKKGDGFAYRGAGWIQVTGRHWFDVIGAAFGFDLISHPEKAGEPGMATLISLEWWKRNNANSVADTGDFTKLSKLVNGGTNGLADRLALTSTAKAALS